MYDGSTSEAFDIRKGVKQGCVLTPTHFRIFFFVMFKHAFGTATEGIYLQTRSDGKVSRLKAKTRVWEVCLSDFLFADDAAVITHTEEELKWLMQHFTVACRLQTHN